MTDQAKPIDLDAALERLRNSEIPKFDPVAEERRSIEAAELFAAAGDPKAIEWLERKRGR